MKKYILFLLLFISYSCLGQNPFTDSAYIDVNNIKALINVHGDMWHSNANGSSACEFPQGSGKFLGNASSLWLAGTDANNQLHLSAKSTHYTQNDYWPGPLDATGSIDYTTSQNWSKVWKVNYTDISAFLSATPHTIQNTPLDILYWPAKGNPYASGKDNSALSVTADMAPFVDIDNDGIYNPLNGDYPLMKGDQMLWTVYNDNGPAHDATGATPLMAEIHLTAYAYSRGTLIDNVIYFDYDIINRSQNSYHGFRASVFADIDLGDAFDEYAQYDSLYRMMFMYNGNYYDNVYDSLLPVAGITVIKLPTDSANYIASLGGALDYANYTGNYGNPAIAADYYNYMHNLGKDGSPFYPDSIWALPYQFLECENSYVEADRRLLLNSPDMDFSPGEHKHLLTALLTTGLDTGHVCNDITLTDINEVADTAWHVYQHPLPPLSTTHVAALQKIKVYPNPVKDILQLDYDNVSKGQIIIYDMLGQELIKSTLNHTISVKQLIPGLYLYRITEKGLLLQQGKFRKD